MVDEDNPTGRKQGKRKRLGADWPPAKRHRKYLDGYCCYVCGISESEASKFVVTHIVWPEDVKQAVPEPPVRVTNAMCHTMDNLVSVCGKHELRLGHMNPQEKLEFLGREVPDVMYLLESSRDEK